MKNKEIVEEKVDELTENPLSAELFRDLPEDQYEQLKRDIQANGVSTPLEITSEKMLLTGHVRLKICKELGYTSVPCIYRRDLVSEESQAERLINDNLLRRQLSDEEIVRIGAWFEAKYHGRQGGDRRSEAFQAGTVSTHERGRTADLVASRLGMSGKTYLKKKAKKEAQTQLNTDSDGELLLDPAESKDFKAEDMPKLVKLFKANQGEITMEITPSSPCYSTDEGFMAVIPKFSEQEERFNAIYRAESKKVGRIGETIAKVRLSAKYLKAALEVAKQGDLIVLKVTPAGVWLENEFMAVVVCKAGC